MFRDYPDYPEIDTSKPYTSATFYSNGTARFTHLNPAQPLTMFGAWRINGSELQIGYQIPEAFRPGAVYLSRRYAKVTNRFLKFFESGRSLTFSGPDEFRMIARPGNSGVIYRRTIE